MSKQQNPFAGLNGPRAAPPTLPRQGGGYDWRWIFLLVLVLGFGACALPLWVAAFGSKAVPGIASKEYAYLVISHMDNGKTYQWVTDRESTIESNSLGDFSAKLAGKPMPLIDLINYQARKGWRLIHHSRRDSKAVDVEELIFER